MGPTITFIAGIALLIATIMFVNTLEGQRWLRSQVTTIRRFTNEAAQPPPATAAPRDPSRSAPP